MRRIYLFVDVPDNAPEDAADDILATLEVVYGDTCHDMAADEDAERAAGWLR